MGCFIGVSVYLLGTTYKLSEDEKSKELQRAQIRAAVTTGLSTVGLSAIMMSTKDVTGHGFTALAGGAVCIIDSKLFVKLSSL